MIGNSELTVFRLSRSVDKAIGGIRLRVIYMKRTFFVASLSVAVAVTGCTTSMRMRLAPVDTAELVASVRSTYSATLDGYGKVWLQQVSRGPDHTWQTFWQQKSWVVFDEGSAQIRFEREIFAEEVNVPASRTEVEYFMDEWRTSSYSLTGDSISAQRPKPSKNALSAHPIHHSGLFAQSPLTALEAMEHRGQLKPIKREKHGELSCIVVEGSVILYGEDRKLRIWLASEQGYLPVKVSMPTRDDGGEGVGFLRYREAKPGVWVLSEAETQFRSHGKSVWRQVMIVAPDFVVNEGAHVDLVSLGSMFPDDDLWEDPWWNEMARRILNEEETR
jgi:hypothetical protein